MERQRKRELRELNLRAWADEKDVFSVDASLDSSMKKNTAFIKRLRTSLAASSTSTFLSEVRTLSLHKYLSEIISACFEGLSKLRVTVDVAAGVEVFSALHQRFGPDNFTRYIGWHIGRGLSTPDKTQLKALPLEIREREEKERLSRHRILLRVATELWLVGALRSLEDVTRPEEAGKAKDNTRQTTPAAPKVSNGARASALDAQPFPLEVLKDLTENDSQHTNLPLLVHLIRTFSWDLLNKKGAEDEVDGVIDQPLLDASMQQRFKNIMTAYFNSAVSHVKRDHQALNDQSRRNAEAYVRSGEVFEDRQANFEKQVKAQERFVANMQALGEALDQTIPELADKGSPTGASDGAIGLVKAGEYLRGEGDGPGIWEDEEERRFYENIVDLKDRVPTILLEDHKKKKTEADEQTGKKAEEKQAASIETAEKPEAKDEEEQSTAIANKTVGAQVDALLAKLPDLTTKESVDEFAYSFCFVNSKASRNRLIKSIQDIPRGRSDLLPLYSRLATILSKYMPDIPQALVSHLDDEFRSLQRRKQKDSLGGVRTSNIRYLAELTKFGLVPEHVIFHCLKVSLDEFSKANIEIICNLMENCGRYLLRNPETCPRMRSFLETLQRKKAAQHLAQQERMLIENAIYYVNPPERGAIQQKERTPIDLFVRRLVYLDLTKRNIEKIAKQLRKLHWEEEEVVAILHKIFVNPHNIKYSNIHFLAIILGALNRYHNEFAITVIDDLLENITLGLEISEFKFNQRRIAEVKYLGELYAYRMVDSSIIFDTLFRLLTFGHYGWPKPESSCPIDLPDDFFRIRLVFVLLDTTGTYFEKGAVKKQLDFFLRFLQYYIHTKDPLPMDIDFDIQDIFALLRPQWKLASSFEEAGAAFAEACKEQYRTAEADKVAESMEAEDQEDLNEDGEVVDGRKTPEEDRSSEDEDETAEEDRHSTLPDSDEEEHIIVTRPEDERDPQEEADFERELAKLLADSMESRKTEKRPMYDISLPVRKAQREGPTTETPIQQTLHDNKTQFSLLSKKGNRTQTRAIDLPSDSSFAIAMRTQQEAERAEQQRIKKLVLNYDTLYNEEDEATNGPTSLPSLERSILQRSSPADGSNGASTQKSRLGKRSQARKLELSDVDW